MDMDLNIFIPPKPQVLPPLPMAKGFKRSAPIAKGSSEVAAEPNGFKKSVRKIVDGEETSKPVKHRKLVRLADDDGTQLDLPESRPARTEQIFSAEKFEDFGFADRLMGAIRKLKLEQPTRIQQAAIPHLLQGRDVLVKAQTGSGKTLVYLLPMMQDLQSNPISRDDGTYAVIISPTRELCLQIFDTLKELCAAYPWIIPGLFIGGEKKKSEKARIRKGVNIIVGTPGRLLDHLKTTQSIVTKNIRWIVLDEVDTLLDAGFEEPVTEIVQILRDYKETERPLQTALVSATLPEGMKRLAGVALKNPVRVEVSAVHVKGTST
eukprot:TRINITY_DN1358_c1_g1_i2.p1 TRINITY_DN1358_c1_g1~~TRINITY_DN1358_c1_g1_i2.p1  ORF type:complete len:321 (+),score=112.63 TRINITY_DN1358_c1_g1_i2:72-1034(+)